MALIIKNQTITPVAQTAPVAKVAPIQQEQIRQAAQNSDKYVASEPRTYEDMGDQYIVVNGKPKKISKHSQYLVDMLTTEE